MSNKKQRFKLSPEISDGDYCFLVDTPAEVVEYVAEWAVNGECDNNDGFSVERVYMTDEEVAALPEGG